MHPALSTLTLPLLTLFVFGPIYSTFAQGEHKSSLCPTINWSSDVHDSSNTTKALSAFEELKTLITNDTHGDIQAVVITQAGLPRYDAYFNGYNTATSHDIRSAAKSIIALLVGIAIDKSLLHKDDSVSSFFPEAELDPRITVEHLLTMASGLDANADDENTPGHENWLYESDDWIQFALNVPMAHPPGEVWSYASLNTFLLGVVLERASGQELEDFARVNLFDPLGMEEYRWTFTPKGHVVAQGNFFITARDLAKIGQLMLNKGCWNGRQLVSPEWIQASLQGQYDVPWQGYDTYGYKWYNHVLEINETDYSYFFASGNGGQKLYVVPEEKLVVVIMTTAYNTRHGQRRSLRMFELILAAIGGQTN